MTYKVTNPRGLYKFADTLKEAWEIYLEWGNAEEFLEITDDKGNAITQSW